jgi:hypothetical protein
MTNIIDNHNEQKKKEDSDVFELVVCYNKGQRYCRVTGLCKVPSVP